MTKIATVLLLAAPAAVLAQTTLINQRWPWPYSGPYQIDTSDTARGLMQGYNRCNSTTENQQSMCVNAHVNSITDFCLYASPTPNSSIGTVEGETVSWCTQPGYGTRTIPPNTLQGVQFLRTPRYLAVVGMFDQTKVDIAAGDYGGELDPHGADNRGNPIGSLMYSNGLVGGNGSYVQVIEWNSFVGSNTFCMRVCNPTSGSDYQDCLNTLDLLGCNYNIYANYAQLNGSFTSCLADAQTPPGQYVTNGQTLTFSQVGEGAQTPPYTPTAPASSSCTTYQSAQLYQQATVISGSITQSAVTSSSSSPSSAVTSSTAAGATSAATAAGGAATMATMQPSAAAAATTSRTGAAPVGAKPAALGLLVGAAIAAMA